jgi:NADPH-dependent ferric siderophore reductase
MTGASQGTAIYGQVERVERLTRHMLRIDFGGAGLDGFVLDGWTDSYLCPLFLRPGTPYEPPFDYEWARKLPREERPVPRRYTVRRWDTHERRLTIDFVVHGDTGVAGRWAQHARAGDRLQLRGRAAGGYVPGAQAECHLMVGDESALPAIAASLERLPAGARAVVVGLVEAPGDELELDTPGELELTWLHRNGAVDDELLARTVADLQLPGRGTHAFVHGEAAETRAVRRHLLADRAISAEALSCSPYWRRRYTDERWREVKADWLREVARDVPERQSARTMNGLPSSTT